MIGRAKHRRERTSRLENYLDKAGRTDRSRVGAQQSIAHRDAIAQAGRPRARVRACPHVGFKGP